MFIFAACFGATLALCDTCLRQVLPTSTTWYVLHAIVNLAVICPLTFPAFYQLDQPQNTVLAPPGSVDQSHVAAIALMHLYHAVAFPMKAEDWFHHLLFIPFNQFAYWLPLLLDWPVHWGPAISVQHFFMCGLPGGLDYCCLALRKQGLLEVGTQKKLQVAVNVWIRVPGGLFSCSIILLHLLSAQQAPPTYSSPLLLADILLMTFNCLYYMQRVIQAETMYRIIPR